MTYASNTRGARMEANGGDYTEAEWQEQLRRQRWRCYNPHCKCDLQVPGVVTERDHMIPVARGGTNNIANMRALCGPCNRRKHAKPWLVFMQEEIARSVAAGNVYGGEGQHANDIGRAGYGGAGSGHFGGGPNSVGDGGAWATVQFLMGVVKGVLFVPLAALLAGLLMLALFGSGRGGNRGSRRLVNGAVGGFGLYRLWTWVFGGAQSRAKFAGVFVGIALSCLWFAQHHGDGESHVEEAPVASAAVNPGKYRVTSTDDHGAPGFGVRPVPLNTGDGPVAVRPLTVIPRFVAPTGAAPTGARPESHGRMVGPAVASNWPLVAEAPRRAPGGVFVAPRRNVGCGWWPIGSDADRDCLAGRGLR